MASNVSFTYKGAEAPDAAATTLFNIIEKDRETKEKAKVVEQSQNFQLKRDATQACRPLASR